MNIFEKARADEQEKKLPSEYFVSRNRKFKVRVSYAKEFWLDNKSYSFSIYGSDFQNRKDFEIFLYKNIKNVSKIISNNPHSQEIFTLKNGLLHDTTEPSYIKTKNGETNHFYFIDGREYSKDEFIKYMRNEKLNRLID